MLEKRVIKNALISVFSKDGLEEVLKKLHSLNITLFSTGGTEIFIKKQGIPVNKVEDLTSYPSILGGRVKTLHPNIFGGILARRELRADKEQLKNYKIPEFDLIIVDLYPFEKTVNSDSDEKDIIEKIDIGGISLIRAAAKNYKDVLVVSKMEQYSNLIEILENGNYSNIRQRKEFATEAFNTSSHYDTAIFKYFNNQVSENSFKHSINNNTTLRYGENPHQKGIFFGNLNDMFEKLNGKELSYNNLLDIDAGVNLISEFKSTTFAILKHNNACGVASRKNNKNAWKLALESDPQSAFGGILISNDKIDISTAKEIHKLFYEVLIAPSFSDEALNILRENKKRIILKQLKVALPKLQFRTALNGVLQQEKDLKTDLESDMKSVTKISPSEEEIKDLIFASKICKHTKSNTIVLVKNEQLLASGTGQTSRVDALEQAITKAKKFNMNLNGAVMASDAFFPFPDCVSIAHASGITSVIQPGGSIKDKLTIDYCNKNNIAMVFTGTRHFKH